MGSIPSSYRSKASNIGLMDVRQICRYPSPPFFCIFYNAESHKSQIQPATALKSLLLPSSSLFKRCCAFMNRGA